LKVFLRNRIVGEVEGMSRESSGDEKEEGFATPKKQATGGEEAESVLRRSIAAVFADQQLTPAQKFARVNELRGMQVSATRRGARDLF
jgi:hypothetical protein